MDYTADVTMEQLAIVHPSTGRRVNFNGDPYSISTTDYTPHIGGPVRQIHLVPCPPAISPAAPECQALIDEIQSSFKAV